MKPETVEELRARLEEHLWGSHERTHELGGEIARRWRDLDTEQRRVLQRHLAKEHRFSRWLLRRLSDPRYLKAWCERINHDTQEYQRRRADSLKSDRLRRAAMTPEERHASDRGLATRDVQ